MRTTSSLWLLGIAEQFKWLGLPVLALFQEANIKLSALSNSSVRIPQDNISQLWQAAERVSGLDNIGLLVGRELSTSPIAAFGLLECNNAVDAINLVLRYQKMIGQASNLQMVEIAPAKINKTNKNPQRQNTKTTIRLDYLFYDDQKPLSVHTRDAAMASTLRVIRLVEGRNWKPLKVQLRRTIKSATEHQAFYNCEVVFEQPRDSLYFEFETASQAERITPTATKQEQHSPQAIPKALAEMIAMVLPEQLRLGKFNRPHIAQLFNISERTLQRRLMAESQTFSEILDQARKNKAHELLSDTDCSQMEVAFMCGFSDLSAFHHAFQRWYSDTPRQYRSHHQDPGS